MIEILIILYLTHWHLSWAYPISLESLWKMLSFDCPSFCNVHLNIMKHFFTVQVIEHWHWLPGEVVEFPFFESHL